MLWARSMDGGGLSLGVKQLRNEADYQPPFHAEVKSGGSVTSLLYISSCHGI
jgi:hypothetical protein